MTDLAAADPRRPALTCGGQTVTRGELESTANRLARHYEQLGVQQGDFVTVALPNGIEFVEALYAIWKLGAVPQPLSWRLPGPELERILALADPALVLGIDAPPGGRRGLPAGCVPDPALSDAPLPPRVSPAWKAPTSGGSTGLPKLIVSGTTAALDVEHMAARFRMHADQVQLVPGPLYHNAPLMLTSIGSALGQHVVVMAKFDAHAALELIGRHRVSFINLVPTMMSRMLRALDERPRSYDLGTLEVVWHMGAPCPAWLKQRWIELVGPDRLHELYGSTETIAGTSIDGREWLERRGSVGRPAYGEMKVVDGDGRPLPAGEVGEIIVRRTPGTPPTYRYVGATAQMRGAGWEALGDMGWMDEDGYLYLVDRRPDMLLVGGANVFPAEVEAVILAHPQVLSCLVVGLPDEDLGQRVHAVVQADGVLEGDALLRFVGERLSRNKVPRSVRFIDEPLRDDAGKVRRAAVREAELARLNEESPIS
ncbi:MAG: bile acid-coenzyme ligase [Solirubrobacteraceae bacterium]